jgi:polysaccharide export outer membrane protein
MRFAISILLFVAACPSATSKFNYAAEPDPRNKELVLGVGDVVGINVWEQKDLNTDATIRPDGTITMPLVGDLRAAGQTPTQLRQTISAALTKFIKLQGTEVTVAVRVWKSYRFTMENEVSRPGVYTADQFVRVADAIAMAGGLTRFAARGDIVLLRTERDGKTRRIPLDYDRLASGKRDDMNIWVLPGDVIFVP